MAAGSGLLLVAGVLQALPAAAAYTSPGAMAGAGARPGATRLSFAAGERVSAQVDVGTGNLLVTTSDLTLPGVGQDVGLGMAYNSASVGSYAPQDSTTSPTGYGWTQLVGWGVVLVPQANGSVIYQGPGGLTGTFTPVSGSSTAYTSPAGFKADLVKTSTGWALSDHASGQVVTFNASGTKTKIADRNGNATTIAYAGTPSLPTSIMSSRGGTNTRTATVSTSGGQITGLAQSVTGGTRSMSYAYTGGDLTSDTDAQGAVTTFTYSAHLLTEVVAPGGADTRFAYDAAHRVTSITQVNTSAGSPGNSVTTLSYPSSAKTLVYEPDQGPTGTPDTYTLTADGTGRVASVLDAAGRSQARTYNANFDALSSAVGTGTTGSTTTSAYGANSGESLTSVADPGGASSSFGYGTAAASKYSPTSTTDPAGNKSLFTYDGAGNQLSAADATGAQAAVTHNADGTVATATSPGNGTNATTYTYDTTHDLTGITPVTGSTLGARAFDYDSNGRLNLSTDGRGVTTNYVWDREDRLETLDCSTTTANPDVTYTYTAAGQVATRKDANGTTTYAYDQMGRLTSRTNSADGLTLTYTYDKSSNLATTTDGAGTTTYTYDAGNKLTSMVGQRSYYFAVDDHGRRTDTWMGANGATSSGWAVHSHTGYDTTGRVAGVTAERKTTAGATSTATRVTDLSYCYAAGSTAPTCSTATSADRSDVQWMRDNTTGQVATYTYDAADRLTKAAVSAGTSTTGTALPAATYAYAYDAAGNRTSATTTGATNTTQTRAYNPANQTTTTGFAYDGAGNLTADPAAGAIAYTPGDQMASVTRAGTAYTYTYAGTGNTELTAQSTPQGTFGYTYGRTDDSGRPVIESATWSGASGTAYLYNDDTGSPVGITTSAGGQALYVYDAMGSPVALIGDGNNTAFTYTFDPYGVAKNTYTSGGNAITQTPFLYTGGLNDRTTGWTKDGNRYYNAGEGRWTQQDTLNAPLDPANANRYEYAGDNPINYVDPLGYASFLQRVGAEVAGAAAGAAGAAVGGTIGSLAGPAGTAVGAAVVGGCVRGVVRDGILANADHQKYSGRSAAQSCAIGLVP